MKILFWKLKKVLCFLGIHKGKRMWHEFKYNDGSTLSTPDYRCRWCDKKLGNDLLSWDKPYKPLIDLNKDD